MLKNNSNKNFFSERILRVPPSGTIVLTDRVREMKKAGEDVVDLTVGEPNFDTPVAIKEAAISALKKGETKYGPSAGLSELRKLIAKKLQSENKINVEEKNILVTPGGKQGLVYAFMSLLNEGDEVVIPEPTWVSYSAMVTIAGGVPVAVATTEENGFKADIRDIESAITKRTKLLVLVNPGNPTGVLYTKKDLERIAEVVAKHDLIVVADEIYEKIVFDSVQFVSFASLPGMFQRTVTINGFSKSHAMTGWRLGYAAAPAPIIEKMLILQQQMATCPNSFSQYGAVYAYSHEMPEVKNMAREYERRRNTFYEEIEKIPMYSALRPEGSFYLFLNVKKFKKNSLRVAEELLKTVKLATVPGSSFGEAGEGYLRLSFATSDKNLKEAVLRLKKFAELAH